MNIAALGTGTAFSIPRNANKMKAKYSQVSRYGSSDLWYTCGTPGDVFRKLPGIPLQHSKFCTTLILVCEIQADNRVRAFHLLQSLQKVWSPNSIILHLQYLLCRVILHRVCWAPWTALLSQSWQSFVVCVSDCKNATLTNWFYPMLNFMENPPNPPGLGSRSPEKLFAPPGVQFQRLKGEKVKYSEGHSIKL